MLLLLSSKPEFVLSLDEDSAADSDPADPDPCVLELVVSELVVLSSVLDEDSTAPLELASAVIAGSEKHPSMRVIASV